MSARCGTIAGYQQHHERRELTCRECRDAQAAWQRRYRIRIYVNRGPVLVDATGSRRRLQSLARIGWSLAALGRELGITGSGVYRITEAERVTEETARRVAELYDRLWDKPGFSKRTRTSAEAHNWAPPMAWDDDAIDDPKARPVLGFVRSTPVPVLDEIAMERAMRGYSTRLTQAERTEVVRRLTERGLSAVEIAERLGKTPRSITRQRSKAAS